MDCWNVVYARLRNFTYLIYLKFCVIRPFLEPSTETDKPTKPCRYIAGLSGVYCIGRGPCCGDRHHTSLRASLYVRHVSRGIQTRGRATFKSPWSHQSAPLLNGDLYSRQLSGCRSKIAYSSG